jgi:acetylornithine/succinyldiaminopimelate/putrescine aminotransferase
MTVGTHGTTFGGGPFATRVGLAVLKEISKPEFTKNVENNGKFFLKELQKIQKKHSNIIEKVDGLGLMIGMWLNKKYNNDSMIEKLLQEGLIATTANGNMVRFLPPLVISKKTIKEGLLLLEQALQKL